MVPFFENIDLEALRSFLGIETVQGIGVASQPPMFSAAPKFSGMLAKGLLKRTVT